MPQQKSALSENAFANSSTGITSTFCGSVITEVAIVIVGHLNRLQVPIQCRPTGMRTRQSRDRYIRGSGQAWVDASKHGSRRVGSGSQTSFFVSALFPIHSMNFDPNMVEYGSPFNRKSPDSSQFAGISFRERLCLNA